MKKIYLFTLFLTLVMIIGCTSQGEELTEFNLLDENG